MLVWLNGRVLPAHQARVSALDRGLLHGDAVYDTWRTYAGAPFAVASHVRRLAAAARALGLPSPGPAAVWEQRSRMLARRNGLGDAAVRLTLTRGAAGETLRVERRARPTLLLTVRALPRDLGSRQARGVDVALLPFARTAGSGWSAYKLTGNASAVAGRRLADRSGAAEGLYITAAGEVTEGTTSNLFLVERGTLVTPPLAAGILPGVTREMVVRLARAAGIAVREETVPLRRLRGASEIFVTASTIEVLPVVRVDGRPIGTGRPGPLTVRLRERYAAAVARSLGRARIESG